jgi:hypothetical protein
VALEARFFTVLVAVVVMVAETLAKQTRTPATVEQVDMRATGVTEQMHLRLILRLARAALAAGE